MKAILLVSIFCCCLNQTIAQTIFPKDEWQTAAPESQNIDSAKLDEAIAYLKENSGKDGVHELVIIRNGYLIWQGDNIDKVHGVWSMTKSFTSTCLGLLIDEGKCQLDTLAKDVLPEMNEYFPTVALRHFATMTSGYRAQGDEPRGGYLHGPSKTPFIPGEPLFAPGSHYAYWDSAMNQFANVLTHIANEELEELFKRRMADPIGMNPKQWKWGDFGEVNGLIVNGGSGNNSNHIQISAREAARFGWLFLNKGKWEDKQLISEWWVRLAPVSQVPATMPNGHTESNIEGSGMYGLNWWTNGIKANGSRKWKDVPASTYSASGYNNNDLFVIPEWNMVIVRLGLDQQEKAIGDSVYNNFLQKVFLAIQN
jgi:CubicO group peptidase (beta-lactamase class C family)